MSEFKECEYVCKPPHLLKMKNTDHVGLFCLHLISFYVGRREAIKHFCAIILEARGGIQPDCHLDPVVSWLVDNRRQAIVKDIVLSYRITSVIALLVTENKAAI